MYYWKYWSLFLKSWAEYILASQPGSHGSAAISSTEETSYLAQYGMQILCLFGQDMRCHHLSPNFTRITGQSAANHLGAAFFSLMHEDHLPRFQQLLMLAASDAQSQQMRCKLRHSDGKWRWYQLALHSHAREEEIEIVCIMENIHEQMLIQNTLQKARLEAELALRARSEFLANMSHELRTPLNAIIGFSQMIENETFGKIENPHYAEYVRHIQESGNDLLLRIEDLLEISNIDAGRVTLTREEVSLGDIAKHVCDTQAHHAFAARVSLVCNVPQQLLLHVDRLKLQHILGHLVANSIKFTRPGGRIMLEAEKTAQGLTIIVRDTGVGMSQDKLEHIESALQEDNCWMAKNNHGIGLGLALTKEFVALHGGAVTVTSHEGTGSMVHIMLPPNCIRASDARPQRIKKPVKSLHYAHQTIN